MTTDTPKPIPAELWRSTFFDAPEARCESNLEWIGTTHRLNADQLSGYRAGFDSGWADCLRHLIRNGFVVAFERTANHAGLLTGQRRVKA